MKFPLTGGCLCGAVKYKITSKPIGTGNCHCRTCQKSVGTPYMPVLFVPYQSLIITGMYQEFATKAASGNTMYRGFCPHCGSSLFGRNSGSESIRPVNAVTLDDPSIYHPQMEFWVSDAQPWDILNIDIPHYQQNPLHLGGNRNKPD